MFSLQNNFQRRGSAFGIINKEESTQGHEEGFYSILFDYLFYQNVKECYLTTFGCAKYPEMKTQQAGQLERTQTQYYSPHFTVQDTVLRLCYKRTRLTQGEKMYAHAVGKQLSCSSVNAPIKRFTTCYYSSCSADLVDLAESVAS